MLLTIERVLILKTVSIFADTAEEQLAEVSLIMEELEVEAGHPVIQQGELGRSMYIIVRGKVRVHDETQTIAELGERDVFGELAALDPEPRMASVTAMEETLLFRLDHDALYELMAEHIEVARGVIHVLCERLRNRG